MAAYKDQCAKVSAAGKEFADHFGGKLLIRSSVHGREVVGLCFSPTKDDPLWTKPDRQAHGMQRPRGTLQKSTKEQRAALAELQADWKARFPTEKADFEPALNSMGTSWDALFFSGYAMFPHDGKIFVSTGATLAPCMVEIVASEYNEANAAHAQAGAA